MIPIRFFNKPRIFFGAMERGVAICAEQYAFFKLLFNGVPTFISDICEHELLLFRILVVKL